MIDNFIIILLAILIEAFPFVIIGALLAGFVEEFVPSSLVTKLMPKRLSVSLLTGALIGVGLPMCECGSVLIVRRLIKKGMPTASAITYMLAGPIVNPITLASTFTAYSWFPQMVLWRAGIGIAVGMITGLLIYKFQGNDITQKEKGLGLEIINTNNLPFSKRFSHAINHAMDDFMMIFSMLLLGATFAALFKAFAPAEVFLFLKKEAWLGVPAFAGLAVLLSLCSEADAFISSALSGIFDIPSQLAFLTLGPMLDLKLIMMYKKVFQKRVFFMLCLIPLLLIISICLMLQRFL